MGEATKSMSIDFACLFSQLHNSVVPNDAEVGGPSKSIVMDFVGSSIHLQINLVAHMQR